MTLTNQEVFTKVYTQFILNGAVLNSKMSYEHLPHGCFIGSLLTEEFAKELQTFCDSLEIYSVKDIKFYVDNREQAALFKNFLNLFKSCDLTFLNELQYVHDSTVFLNFGKEKLKQDLKNLAEKYNLTIPTST